MASNLGREGGEGEGRGRTGRPRARHASLPGRGWGPPRPGGRHCTHMRLHAGRNACRRGPHWVGDSSCSHTGRARAGKQAAHEGGEPAHPGPISPDGLRGKGGGPDGRATGWRSPLAQWGLTQTGRPGGRGGEGQGPDRGTTGEGGGGRGEKAGGKEKKKKRGEGGKRKGGEGEEGAAREGPAPPIAGGAVDIVVDATGH